MKYGKTHVHCVLGGTAHYSKQGTISLDILQNYWQVRHTFSFCFYVPCYDSVCISIFVLQKCHK